MIVKHFDSRNGTCFYEAKSIRTHLCNVKDDQAPSSDESLVQKIQRISGFPQGLPITVVSNIDDDNLSSILAVLLNKENNEDEILVFSENVFLMTNAGKTIERLPI